MAVYIVFNPSNNLSRGVVLPLSVCMSSSFSFLKMGYCVLEEFSLSSVGDCYFFLTANSFLFLIEKDSFSV